MSKIRLQSLLTVAVLAAMAILPRRGEAQVIYDNGVPDEVDGRTVSPPYSVADNFTLSSAATVGSFQWYAVLTGSDGAATASASYDWNILSDVAGAPGTVLLSGTAAGQTGTKTTYLPQGFFTYYFDTPVGSLPLGAGTYWLAIGSFSSPASLGYWATSSQQGDAVQSGDGGATYLPTGQEMAFTISGTATTTTPEPGSIVLLATGLMGVLGVDRRRSA